MGVQILVGSRPPKDKNLWNFITEKDYDVNAEMDSTLGQAISFAVSSHLPGVLVLIAGDRAYLGKSKYDFGGKVLSSR